MSPTATSSDLGEEAAIGPAQNPFSRFAFKPQATSRTEPPNRGESTASIVSASPGKRKGPEGTREENSGATKKGRSMPLSTAIPSSSSPKIPAKSYDHLNPIPDHLCDNLNIVFCGINPGQQSATIGHHYGNPNNHFWSCLHESGLTSRRLDPREDHLLQVQFSIGLTNLVERPTAQQNELSRREQVASVPSLLEKVSRFRPRLVCFVGLGIAEIVNSSISCSNIVSERRRSEKIAVGLQKYKMVHDEGDNTETLFFAVSSTSGRVVRYQKEDKVQQFRDLHELSLKLKEGSLDTRSLTRILSPSPVEGHSFMVPSREGLYVKSLRSSNVAGGSEGSGSMGVSSSFGSQKSVP